MSSVRKPRMPKPRIPKIKKPSISKTKKLRKKPSSISVRKPNPTKTKNVISAKPTNKKKHSPTRRQIGTCYLQLSCRSVLAKDVSKTQCKNLGGRSWKKSNGTCERLS